MKGPGSGPDLALLIKLDKISSPVQITFSILMASNSPYVLQINRHVSNTQQGKEEWQMVVNAQKVQRSQLHSKKRITF